MRTMMDGVNTRELEERVFGKGAGGGGDGAVFGPPFHNKPQAAGESGEAEDVFNMVIIPTFDSKKKKASSTSRKMKVPSSPWSPHPRGRPTAPRGRPADINAMNNPTSPPKIINNCLELPAKQTREMMRQVSGLGMEDPVFGLASNHSMVRRATKKMPFLFEDMKLEDIPQEMVSDMISVCSDPTASIVGELPSMRAYERKILEGRADDFYQSYNTTGTSSSNFFRFHQSHNTNNNNSYNYYNGSSANFSRFHQSLNSSALFSSTQQSRIGKKLSSSTRNSITVEQQGRSRTLSPTSRAKWVPPISVSQLQGTATSPELQTKKTVDAPLVNASIHDSKRAMRTVPLAAAAAAALPEPMARNEKPSDRRWRKSMLAHQIHLKKDHPTSNSSSNKEKDDLHHTSNNAQHYRSFDDFMWNDNKAKGDKDEEDGELELEDLMFSAGKMKKRQPKGNIHSRLSASDSNLVYNHGPTHRGFGGGAGAGNRLSRGGGGGIVEGLEVHIGKRDEFSRTVSGLTLDNSQSEHGSSQSLNLPGDHFQPNHELMAVLKLETHPEEVDETKDHTTADENDKNCSELDEKNKDYSRFLLRKDNSKLEEQSLTINELGKSIDTNDIDDDKDDGDDEPHSSREELKSYARSPSLEKKKLSAQNRKLADSMSKFHRRANESRNSCDTHKSSRRERTSGGDPLSPKERAMLERKRSNVRRARSHSVEGSVTKEDSACGSPGAYDNTPGTSRVKHSAAAVHRRPPARKGPPKSHSHDAASRMMAFGNASLKASERADEIKSKFHRYKAGPSSKDRATQKGRGSSGKRGSTDLHASMSIMVTTATTSTDDEDNAVAAGMNKSCGDLDIVMSL